MKIQEFFDKATSTLSYVVFDESSHDGVVIDPVLDYEPAASKISYGSADILVDFIKKNEIKLHYILETHVHADHMTSAQVIKKSFPTARVAIGERIKEVQVTFKKMYGLPDSFKTDGSQFDRLLSDQETFQAGTLTIKAIPTPGHTPACVSYLIGDAVFTGDALFMPDSGTGRCDFPAGSADELYHSVHDKLYSLRGPTKVYVGHDYQPNSRALEFCSTIESQKTSNIHLKAQTSPAEYVNFRKKRDKELAAPRLLLPSLQININAGRLPEPDTNGVRYLRIPLSI